MIRHQFSWPTLCQRRLRAILLGLFVAAAAILPGMANAAELIMFRRPGCPWCVAWDRQIGPIWPKTEVGQRFPIRMVDITDKNVKSGLNLKIPVVFTPTFVLVHENKEVGRFEGYPGEEFFWGLIERLVKTVPPSAG
ncbi:MAG: thioredoxin family protein [Beijerinckiaceae bacterium]